MRKIKQVLRLHFENKLSKRKIATSLNISRETVTNYICRAEFSKLKWDKIKSMGEMDLEKCLFPPIMQLDAKERPKPDWANIHQELKKKRKGATLQGLHGEFLAIHPDGIGYSYFCEEYRAFKKTLKKYMRQIYKAGEKVFVDYCGPTMPIKNLKTGETKYAQIFVGVLGASNYIFACANWSQKVEHWIMCHVKMFEFFEGVPELVVCDNLKSAVTKVSRIDPVVNATYQDLADHYGTAIFPARPYKPQDKSKAENGVLIIERWILFRLRKQTFTSLHELNTAIMELLDDVNKRPFKKLPGNRIGAFESLDKPALISLPSSRYVYTEFKKVRVSYDYHIDIYGHKYSVPHNLVGKEIEARLTADVIEALHKGSRVCSHARSYEKGITTDENHMPSTHRHYYQFSEEGALDWALTVGANTHAFMQAALSKAKRKEEGYRLTNGLKKLNQEYGSDRLESACKRTLGIGASALRNVRSILQTNLDRQAETEAPLNEADFEHNNVRGSNYYH